MSQAELPSRGTLVSRLSPYALVVLEGCAARTSTASGATPLWLPEAARAFNLPVTSGCSSLHLALFDEVVREEAVKEEDVRGEVVARAREGQEGAGKGPEVVLEAVRGVEVEAGMEVEVAAAAAAAAAAVAEATVEAEAEAEVQGEAEVEAVQVQERTKPPPSERRSEGHGAGHSAGHASMSACLSALSEAKGMAKDLAKEAKGRAKEGLKGVDSP